MEEIIELTGSPETAYSTFLYVVENLFNWDGSGRGELMGEEAEGVPLVSVCVCPSTEVSGWDQ